MCKCRVCAELYDPEDAEFDDVNDDRGQDLCYDCYLASYYSAFSYTDRP